MERASWKGNPSRSVLETKMPSMLSLRKRHGAQHQSTCERILMVQRPERVAAHLRRVASFSWRAEARLRWGRWSLSLTIQAPSAFSRPDLKHSTPSAEPKLGVGQKKKTRNWTADFSPCFLLPRFHFGYLLLTHSQLWQDWKWLRPPNPGKLREIGCLCISFWLLRVPKR